MNKVVYIAKWSNGPLDNGIVGVFSSKYFADEAIKIDAELKEFLKKYKIKKDLNRPNLGKSILTKEFLIQEYVYKDKEWIQTIQKIMLVGWKAEVNPLFIKKLENILRYKKAFAAVAIEEDKIIGFVVYYAEKNNYIISRMAVHPEYRRKGCGKILIEKICSKLSLLKKHIDIVVKESNVGAQLFFKSMNFNVVETIREKFTTYHDDLPSVPYIEDGLVFRFKK